MKPSQDWPTGVIWTSEEKLTPQNEPLTRYASNAQNLDGHPESYVHLSETFTHDANFTLLQHFKSKFPTYSGWQFDCLIGLIVHAELPRPSGAILISI